MEHLCVLTTLAATSLWHAWAGTVRRASLWLGHVFFDSVLQDFSFVFFITIFFHEDIEMRKLLRHLCLTLSGIPFLLCLFVFPSLWVIVSFLFLCFSVSMFFLFLCLFVFGVYRFFSASLFFEFWLSNSFCFIILSLRLSFYNKLHFLFSIFF